MSSAETLMVRCPQCSASFRAGLQVDRASLEAMVVSNTYRCPRCGHESVYVKADHMPLLMED
jgi:C4-type Zn-finger protein